MYFGRVRMCVGEKKCKVDVEECTTSHSAKEGMTRGACDHGFHRSVSNKIYYTVFTVIDFFFRLYPANLLQLHMEDAASNSPRRKRRA